MDIDLTPIPTPTLQIWYSTITQAILTGQRLTSASYAQGDGSKSASFMLNSGTDQQANLKRIADELARRGVLALQPRRRGRRRIGIQF